MPGNFFCVAHAMSEELVVASSVHDGRSMCAHHTGSSDPLTGLQTLDSGQCDRCRRVPHRAFFVVGSEKLCIRHAADAVFPEDDMGAHDMAHAAYLRLKADGVEDAY